MKEYKAFITSQVHALSQPLRVRQTCPIDIPPPIWRAVKKMIADQDKARSAKLKAAVINQLVQQLEYLAYEEAAKRRRMEDKIANHNHVTINLSSPDWTREIPEFWPNEHVDEAEANEYSAAVQRVRELQKRKRKLAKQLSRCEMLVNAMQALPPSAVKAHLVVDGTPIDSNLDRLQALLDKNKEAYAEEHSGIA